MIADITLMTVDEFRELPEGGGEFEYELHSGEVFSYRRPKLGVSTSAIAYTHSCRRSARYESLMAFPYRALSEYDLRVADVGLVSRERYLGH